MTDNNKKVIVRQFRYIHVVIYRILSTLYVFFKMANMTSLRAQAMQSSSDFKLKNCLVCFTLFAKTASHKMFSKIAKVHLLSFIIILTPIYSHAETTSKPVLTIATMAFNPPFETSDRVRQVFSGFEIEIMSAVCQRLNVDCKFIARPNIIDVFNDLSSGKVDLAMGSIIVLKGDTDYIYSTPYLPSGIQFFAKQDSNLKTISDIVKSRIGTTDDSLIESLIKINYAKDHSLSIYDTPQAGIDALASDSIDVFVMQAYTAKYWVSNTSHTFKLIGTEIPFGLGNGIMARKDSIDLINTINQALVTIKQDGTYDRIYNQYAIF